MDKFARIGASLVIAMALAGCLQGTGTSTAPAGAPEPRPAEVVERDVEAPDVFSETDEGLWDGRPSLGGVWVAHPDVDAPERVIIRNTENGQETIGALFKRERMNPGPVFQVSAEAASAVRMLAGAPTRIEVVALRTEEVPVAPPAPAPAPAQDGPGPEDAAADTGTETPQPAPTADETPVEQMPEAEETPRRGFFARLFGGGDDDDTADDSVTTEPLTAMAPAASGAAASAAPDAPLPMPTPQGRSERAAPEPATAPSDLDRPFVQIGIFSVEGNARGAAGTMRDAGLAVRVSPGNTQGNTYWRVVVGPAQTEAERSSILEQVRDLGFADAYPVRR